MRCYNRRMFDRFRPASARLLLVLAMLVSALLCRSALIGGQMEHALTMQAAGNSFAELVVSDNLLAAGHDHEDMALSQALHDIVHFLDTLSSHPPVLPVQLTLLPKRHERIVAGSQHVPEPPVSSLFRPPRASSLS